MLPCRDACCMGKREKKERERKRERKKKLSRRRLLRSSRRRQISSLVRSSTSRCSGHWTPLRPTVSFQPDLKSGVILSRLSFAPRADRNINRPVCLGDLSRGQNHIPAKHVFHCANIDVGHALSSFPFFFTRKIFRAPIVFINNKLVFSKVLITCVCNFERVRFNGRWEEGNDRQSTSLK